MQIKRYGSGKRMSQAVVHGGLAFLAGQVADDPSQDVKGQTAQILAKIDRLLEQAGSDKTRILSASIWLADYTTFNEMNEIWDAWVPEGEAPARACVESKLAFPQYTVEIGVIAAV
ncbi:RidA family protein [Burkholderia sp. JKS000303]|uniref:RidA family protein n=1 Tax=Burkholderia sp. JKS000303 TaxID=1938747 RepID=UPI000BF992DD|nr:RidA family protein [Burkholderia sp. JKS000303]PFH20181.1 enamine deaminase RidA (YjgF/YER057c/UK114 family) [Burkholderia sp. JKS000303]